MDSRFYKIIFGCIVASIFVGILMRFWHITQPEFFLYDEGLYFNYNHNLVDFIRYHGIHSKEDFQFALLLWFRFSMASGKALWFLLLDSRIFLGWMDVLFIPRLVSAVSGVMTIGVTFLFARRLFGSTKAGLLSAVLLAVLPSHVFYSRLAFQEALSTLFLISGFYCYLFPRKLCVRTFVGSLLLVGAYFTNYRMIVLPVLVAFTEFVFSLSEKRPPDIRKYIWHTLAFLACIVIIGNLDLAENALVTYSWMFHQADLARDQFDWINVLSYPYYLFRLESFIFGILFFGNVYFIWKKEWPKLVPFAIVCFQMLMFSLPAEKGARYLCVVTPFMAMAVAALVVALFEKTKTVSIVLSVLLISSLFYKSFQIVQSRSAYGPAMAFLNERDPNARVLSTQPWIELLYAKDKKSVYETPHQINGLFALYSNGFRYLILCPQTYISWTKDGNRFTEDLENYLPFFQFNVKPINVFEHLNQVMLERFVFEHNENLRRSIKFLNSSDSHLGEIRIYDIKQGLTEISQWITQQKKNKEVL